jgi:FixJ family two-component response regulator
MRTRRKDAPPPPLMTMPFCPSRLRDLFERAGWRVGDVVSAAVFNRAVALIGCTHLDIAVDGQAGNDLMDHLLDEHLYPR